MTAASTSCLCSLDAHQSCGHRRLYCSKPSTEALPRWPPEERFLRRPETDGNSINYPLAAAICQYDKEDCATSAAVAAPEP
jgi:hypothetical protein